MMIRDALLSLAYQVLNHNFVKSDVKFHNQLLN